MSVLLQISDTHFGTEQPAVLDALLHLTDALRPEVIVWSGDITQRARRRQFDGARDLLHRLRDIPVLAVPGNHDIPLINVPARLLFPYAGYRRVFGAELEPQYDSNSFFIRAVKTTRRYRHVDGEVSSQQIERVANELRSAPADRVRIVVTHQPVHVIKPKDEKNLLNGHEAAVRSWASAGADIVMGGHIHLPYIRPLAERFAALPRRIWIVQAGTAISHRVRHSAPNSVNVLRHDAARPLSCTAERWDYDTSQARFGCVATESLDLQR